MRPRLGRALVLSQRHFTPIPSTSTHHVFLPTITLNTSRPFSLLSIFNRDGPPKNGSTSSAAGAHREWLNALDTGRIPQIQRTYKLLLRWLAEPPSSRSPPPPSPSEADVKRMVELLSRSTNPDVEFLQSVISHCAETFGHPPDIAMHTAMVRALVSQGSFDDAFAWIDQAVAGSSEVAKEVEIWDIMASGYHTSHDFAGLERTLDVMRTHGVSPSAAFYRCYVESVFASDMGRRTPSILRLSQELRNDKAHEDPRVLSSLLVGFVGAGMLDEAAGLATSVRAALQKTSAEDPRYANMMDALCMFESRSSGLEAVWPLLEAAEPTGFRPSSSTVAAVLRGMGDSATPEHLRTIGAQMNVDPQEDAWTVLINHALSIPDYQSAFDIYNQATTSLPPSVALVSGLFASQQYYIAPGQTLMDIYQDLHATESRSSNPTLSSDRQSLRLYENLLLSVANCKDRLLVPKALTVLVDMRNASVAFDPAITLRVAQALMNSSWSHNAAYNMYTNIRALGTRIGEDGYRDLLTSFVSLKVHRGSAYHPPPRLFFSIVKDMTDDGYNPDLDIFTILFRRLRKSAINVRYTELGGALNPNHELLHDIRRAHSLFRMHAAVTPDVEFLNLVMDCYSRTGGFEEAMDLFQEEILVPKIFNGKSISIALDTCSHYGAAGQAHEIWSYLENWEAGGPRRRIPAKLWETWIESLCRLGLIDQVRRTLIHEVGTPETRKGSKIPEWRLYATDTMLQIPLAFDWGPDTSSTRATVVSTLRNYFPQINTLARSSSRKNPPIPEVEDDIQSSS